MADKPQSIAVLHEGILAGNAFIDRHQDFLFPQELKQMAQVVSLSLNDLSDTHRGGKFACQIPLAIGRLELAH
jgi:hypothetical protein